MVDAVPQYLDPSLGSTVPRPPGFRAGEFPLQANANKLAFWTIGVSTRAIRPPFGTSVGEPLHYEYDLCPTNLVAIDCRGDPTAPDDRSVVQIAQDNPPQAGRVFPTWFWYDWMHSTASAAVAFNRSLATKSVNAYCGQQSRAGQERPVLGVTALTANGGSVLTLVADWTLAAPGSATKATLNCPLVAEDGSAAAPQPLRVPCWVGRWGFRGEAGQVLAGGTSSQNLGFVLKLRPLAASFVNEPANLRIAFTSTAAEYGCEVYGGCAYTLWQLDGPNTYLAPDFNQGAPWPCYTYSQLRCWMVAQLSAYTQIYLTPLGDAWQAVVAITQMTMRRTNNGQRYCWPGMHGTPYYNGIGSLTMQKPADQVSATPIAFGSTTTITRQLFSGEASLQVTITTSATGKITLCEARIVRGVTVGNLGAGWHDIFWKL
jgi:hypothetical protein